MYSERLMSLFRSQAHAGELESATHRGQAGEPGMGPWLTLALRLEGERVVEARYATYGCPAAAACGEALCALSEGRELAALQAAVSAETLRQMGGGVPEGKEHCPELAAEALREAKRQKAKGKNGEELPSSSSTTSSSSIPER